MRFKDLSVLATKGVGGTLATDALAEPFTIGVFTGALDGALAGVEVVDLTTFLAGSAESVSDSRGRFLVIILDCEPGLTPPKKFSGSDDLWAAVGLTGLVTFAAADLGGCLVSFST